MVKIRKVYEKGFTTIDNTILNDVSLSWKAKGLFVYLWSQSDEWNFYEKEVMNHASDGLASLRAGIHELEAKGYLLRKRQRKSGQVKGSIWLLKDSPKCDFLNQEKPDLEKPKQEKPKQENQNLTSTNLNKYQSKQKRIISLSEREENQKIRIKIVANYFEHWGHSLKPTEVKKLKTIVDNFNKDELEMQCEKALAYADDYPFGYLMVLLKNELEKKKIES